MGRPVNLLAQPNMDLRLETDHLPAGGEAAAPMRLFASALEDPEAARVSAAQQLLFPADPQALCEEIGLNWWAALKLHEDGWLSFAPQNTPRLDGAQEAELRFVGSLVLAGCDRQMLGLLLAGLPKPYAYELEQLYFDWGGRRWRLLPDPRSQPEAVFADWIEELVQTGDVGSLTGIGELARDALARVKGEETETSDA